MKLRLLVLLIFLSTPLCLFGAEPEFYFLRINPKIWKEMKNQSFLEGKVSPKILESLDEIYAKNPTTYEFLFDKKNNAVKAFIQCTFDTYTIIGDELIKDYKLNNRGYTCGSYFFTQNGVTYLVGGSGFWHYHTDLIRFEKEKGSWEYTKTENQPIDFFPFGTFKNEKGIFLLFGQYRNPRISKTEDESRGFFLDLEKKSWQPIAIETNGFDLNKIAHEGPNENQLFDAQDYALNVTTSLEAELGWNIWVIFDKKTGKIYLHEGINSADIFNAFRIETIGNKIFYSIYDKSSEIPVKDFEIDLNTIKLKSKEVGEIKFIEAPVEKEIFTIPTFLAWLGIPILIAIGILIGIYLKNNTQLSKNNGSQEESNEEEGEAEYEQILNKLVAHNGERLTTETFDVLLGIHQISNFDSKRIKRARLIKAINKQYVEKKGFQLITRIKNPEDKRFVYYQIRF